MDIKNTSHKLIGFRSPVKSTGSGSITAIHPGETKEIDIVYNSNPLVLALVERGWLETDPPPSVGGGFFNPKPLMEVKNTSHKTFGFNGSVIIRPGETRQIEATYEFTPAVLMLVERGWLELV